MKKIFLIVTIVATAFMQNSFAQPVPTSREETTTAPSQLLQSYLSIKNALVAGKPANASAGADEFVKALNDIDIKIINEATRNALLKDATHIAESKDISHQRELFSAFSDNMIALAKTVKLSEEPLYLAYCPMKKSSWLSSEKTIKNPYYGSSMLTCGSIKETIK